VTGSGKAHRGTTERLATGLEQAVRADRAAAAVGLQPLGGRRGSQRRWTTGSRPDIPIDQFTEDLRLGAALTSILHWFETDLLTKEENLIGLMALSRETLGQAEYLNASGRVALDIDFSKSPVHSDGQRLQWAL